MRLSFHLERFASLSTMFFKRLTIEIRHLLLADNRASALFYLHVMNAYFVVMNGNGKFMGWLVIKKNKFPKII